MVTVESTRTSRNSSLRNNDGGLDSHRDQPAATAAGWMF